MKTFSFCLAPDVQVINALLQHTSTHHSFARAMHWLTLCAHLRWAQAQAADCWNPAHLMKERKAKEKARGKGKQEGDSMSYSCQAFWQPLAEKFYCQN